MFNEYPYRNLTDLNLDFILKAIKNFQNELTNFVNFNSIKYADPIQWNITSQYATNTIVIDALTGIAYISTKPVSVGITLDNTDYWTPVFNLSVLFGALGQNFTSRDNGANTTIDTDLAKDKLILLNGSLYVALVDLTAGSALIDGVNIARVRMEDYIPIYYSNEDKLVLKGVIDGNPIQTLGDYHVYDAPAQAIKIIKV